MAVVRTCNLISVPGSDDKYVCFLYEFENPHVSLSEVIMFSETRPCQNCQQVAILFVTCASFVTLELP